MSSNVVDLTNETCSSAVKAAKPSPASVLQVTTPSTFELLKKTALKRPLELPSGPSAMSTPSLPLAKKKTKASSPHVLLWICHAGPGQSGRWTGKNLKVIGVYGSKETAQTKKDQLMEKYENCGHGDILVGDSWEDEIDLVIRPAGEFEV